jgi:hypothetical protein
MRFAPPFCPNRKCPLNRVADAGFARPHGWYYSRALGRLIPRYRCSGCRRTFSYSTFRFSYRQKKPHLDATVMRVLCSGVSLRGAARLLEVNRKTVARKLARLGRHSHRLHRALLAAGSLNGEFQLDELETFESNRFQPVTVPVLIEKNSYFVVATHTAPLRRKGRMTPRQKKMRAEHEALNGRRPSDSDSAVRQCLGLLDRHATRPVVLESDRKPSYGRLGPRLLGGDLTHRTHSSRTRRDHRNPLFPINHTNAMLRYCLARLRRRTWCVTRLRGWLQWALDMYAGWFNYCRGITNKTRVSPAQAMGLAQRRLRTTEWLSWRQDWHNAGRILPTGIRTTLS